MYSIAVPNAVQVVSQSPLSPLSQTPPVSASAFGALSNNPWIHALQQQFHPHPQQSAYYAPPQSPIGSAATLPVALGTPPRATAPLSPLPSPGQQQFQPPQQVMYYHQALQQQQQQQQHQQQQQQQPQQQPLRQQQGHSNSQHRQLTVQVRDTPTLGALPQSTPTLGSFITWRA
eukprot:TRINITY_DN11672_c0_g1_i1.p1 TRINITY_DN11672_c0_g1~~TRINITY_DN11672_c0_g1_i1.p1  ORF type:complete len:174 (-),score=40.75 TRINITY_DN11672_c0_g1_i1:297-818(-)